MTIIFIERHFFPQLQIENSGFVKICDEYVLFCSHDTFSFSIFVINQPDIGSVLIKVHITLFTCLKEWQQIL